MWKELLIPIDNSEPSDQAADAGVAIAKHCGAKIIGMHAYDMAIHKKRFKTLMPHLKEGYQEPEKKDDLRVRHNDIMGLSFTQLSESMLKPMEEKAALHSLHYESKVLKGKHADAICEYVKLGGTDLIVMGATGQGSSAKTGGCAKKVVRRIADRDIVLIRNSNTSGKIIVGIDGSEDSFKALQKAIELSKCFGSRIIVASIFDLNLHNVVFKSMKHVMAGEADQVFNSEAQEKLHEQVIDSGIGKVYRANAEEAKRIASKQGVEIETIVEPGRAEEKIVEIASKENASFVVCSRLGLHKTSDSDIGSVAEALMTEAGCNVVCCHSIMKQSNAN